jgi:cytochrome c biogenesis protein CcmG, thiol:disulfide interchange protein DsbE
MASRRTARRWALALSLSLSALPGLPACAGPGLPPSAPSPAVGRPVPAFSRRALTGAPVTSESLRGKVVVVEFFAQYCKPCWQALPEVAALAAEDEALVVVGFGEDEYAAQTQDMVTQLGLPFAVVHDAGNVMAGRFRVREIPATLVVDAAGVVRWQARRTDGVRELRRAIEAVRRGDPQPP